MWPCCQPNAVITCRWLGLTRSLELPSCPSCLKDKQPEQLKLETNELFKPFPEEPETPTMKKGPILTAIYIFLGIC